MGIRIVTLSMFAIGCHGGSSLGYVEPPPQRDQTIGLGGLGLDSQLANQYARQRELAEPPVRLTPTDGSELALRRLNATVTITGPIAHTELAFAFHNGEARTREGRFAITMPATGAITRFAMKVNGTWREARIVARDRGRQVYESYLHKKVDPALLEQDLGNAFSARVFPIGPNEDKEIIVAYDSQVDADHDYTLALHGLPRVGQIAISIDNNGETRAIEQVAAIPEDVHVEVTGGVAAVATGDAFAVRVDGVTGGGPAPLDRVLYLVDTSASRAPVMLRQLEMLHQLLTTQSPESLAAVVAFDHAPIELYRGPARQALGAIHALSSHGALGASDLGAALERAATAGVARVVIIGDGVATLGEHDATKLAHIVATSPIERVDAVRVGQSLDRETLQRIVSAGKQPGAILEGPDAASVARQLATAIAPPVAIRVEGATATWPRDTRHVAPGDPIFVFGLRDPHADWLAVHVGTREVSVTPREGPAGMRRVVARAELAELVDELAVVDGAAARDALGAQIEKLALAHELVSPRTSLIVLETDRDERAMLGPREGQPDPTAPNGSTITQESMRNIPVPGRTFERALGVASGAQRDATGVSFSGSTSLENQYIVDGVNTTGLVYGTGGGELVTLDIMSAGPGVADRPRIRADVMSPLALDLAAEAINHDAFAFGRPGSFHDDAAPQASEPTYTAPYTGRFRAVMAAIARHDRSALGAAAAWQLENPGDVAAILALGEALEARGAGALAARAYGSIADLYPNRAELLRTAGERLDRIATADASRLAIDCYRRALRERTDQVSTYRLLAFALLRANRPDEALTVLEEGMRHTTRPSVQHILAEDAGLVGAYLVAREPVRRDEVTRRLPVGLASKASLRFVLSWETDANDVDLHVRDSRGGHAFYKGTALPSGGRLLDDLTDGYGPEMFVVENPAAFPYRISAHYYSKGPMGLGLGTVQVIRHDGHGNVTIEDRPFVIQNDHAMVELGAVAAR